MKKIKYSVFLLIGILIASACSDEPDRILFNGPHFVSFARTNVIVNESATSGTATVVMSRTFPTDVTVSYSVETENATEGVDYTVDQNSIVIPAGEYEGTFTITPINNEIIDAARRIRLTITSISEASLNPSAENEVTIAILNDDCPVETSIWTGDIESTESYDDGTGWGPFLVSMVPNEAGDCDILEISNIGDLGGDAAVVITFTPDSEGATTGTVEIERQGTGSFGSSGERTVQGSGIYDETSKVIEMHLIFRFGDGSVYYEAITEFIGN
jgi:hypothetical protein